MQLKQEANTEPRKKFHLTSRLRKAARVTTELEMLCESPRCDARTKLEAQAYAAWMHGLLQFEGKDWASAMEFFHKAQMIYEKLASALNEDEKMLYQQRVDEITPNVRYCAYNIGDESAIQDLKKMRRNIGQDVLAENLDMLISQTMEKQAATLSEVTWRGRTIPVKHEKVRVFLLNVQESEEEVQRATDSASKISVYESLLMECKDVSQLLRDELHADPARTRQQGDGQISSLQHLYSYVTYIRLTKTVERNLLLVDSLRRHLNQEGKKGSKPQDLIRMYESIIQCLTEMEQLPGVGDDGQFSRVITAQLAAYKCYRCYYIAHSFVAAKKWIEAIAIYDRAHRYAQDALAAANILNKKLVGQLQELVHQIDGQKFSVHAFSILGKDDSGATTDRPSIEAAKPLVDRLDEYCEDPGLISKRPKVTDFPPDFRAIPCKPLFFDLAFNHVELPSLDDRVEQKKGGGLTGMVKGWLWGSAKK